MRRRLFATVTLLSALFVPATGRAEEAKPDRRWYGWQILAADASTVATTVLLGGRSDLALPVLFFGSVLSGPIAHGAHGNVGTAFASLGLRVALPVAGGYVGCAMDPAPSELYGCLGGAFLGLVAGITAASAIDSAALAYDTPRPKPKWYEITPTGGISSRSALIGVQGTF